MTDSSIQQKAPRFRWQLAAITLARLFLNTGLRMVYPFAPAFARGLDVPVTAVYRLIAMRNVAGFFSPVLGPLAQRYGRKVMMMVSALLFGLGCLLVVVWPAYWSLGAALAILAFAKVIFDPAMQSYVGDAVPYQQRGKALAVTEYAWSLAFIVGAPAVGLAIQRQGWSAPFFWLGVLSLTAVFVLWRVLPRRNRRASEGVGWRETVSVLRRNPVIWLTFLYITLATGANEMLFIIYGDWMETSFSLSLASLGLASGVIGGSEIIGETFAGWSVDRFGKRPVIITTGVLNGLLYVLIPHTSGSLTAALITLFFLFLTFEITLVGGMPLMTELVPRARGVVMTMVLAAMSMGRLVGATFGPVIWLRGGFVWSGIASGLMMGTAVFILSFWIREGE
ncbi:MAG: MFS transporter [Chloroflexi bacterium]|nr:MFS transporter [Chloroflexota bacterium]MBK6713108.1 MFS transporter [Chloroflexota bacterium]MBK7181234.1 MFS transporter [Chloroflexota bacterium]MBK7918102.1 MFS transporter [Chloroflexota bacterium]MBK8932356.1 MFS transporter [Chloroflexota bacterium]